MKNWLENQVSSHSCSAFCRPIEQEQDDFSQTIKRHMRGWVTLAMTLIVAMARTEAAELKPGDMAADFTLPGSDGKTYRLSDFRGKRAVVLAWFPKAFTGG